MSQHELELKANERQVGGNHYRKQAGVLQHWDVVALFNLDYFQGNVSKYLFRWRDKNGIEDLEKSQHYIQKYIEIERARAAGTLTRQILERAIRELEGIEAQEDMAAAYRAQAKGDDPVGDALSGYPFRLVPEAAVRTGRVSSDGSLEANIPKSDPCVHGTDDCPVHPNGGCPPLHTVAARP